MSVTGSLIGMGDIEADRLGDRRHSVGMAIVGLALLGALWWITTGLLPDSGSFIRRFSPVEAGRAALVLFNSWVFLQHCLSSLQRIGVGLLIAVCVGIPAGLVLGGVPMVARTMSASIQLVRMISPLSWTPLAIVVFGVGNAPVYFLVAISGVWPIVLSTSTAVEHLEREWLTVGRSLGATRGELLRWIVWPGIRHDVVTGIRLATGVAWIVIVPAEMLGVDAGVGYFILDARDRFAYGELMAAILAIGLLGSGIDGLTRWVLRSKRQRTDGNLSVPRQLDQARGATVSVA